MELSTLPVAPQQWQRTMKQDGQPILVIKLRRPSAPDRGKAKRMERYFARFAQLWQDRWENSLFPRACQAYSETKECGKAFTPWQAELDYEITFWQPPLVSLCIRITETGPDSRPLCTHIGETWDCSNGFPRTLRSFFTAQGCRWRQQVISALSTQAEAQLASGESLLDPDCTQVMKRTFDPDRFYLTEEGAAIFYPMYLLGPYAEGVPIFTIPLQE